MWFDLSGSFGFSLSKKIINSLSQESQKIWTTLLRKETPRQKHKILYPPASVRHLEGPIPRHPEGQSLRQCFNWGKAGVISGASRQGFWWALLVLTGQAENLYQRLWPKSGKLEEMLHLRARLGLKPPAMSAERNLPGDRTPLWPRSSKEDTSIVASGIWTQNVHMEFLCSWERGISLVSIENLQVQGSFYLKMTKDELCNSQKKWATCRTKLCLPSSHLPLLLAPGSGSYSRLGVQPKTLHSPLTVLFFSYPLIQSCWLLKLYADSVTVLQLHLQSPIRPSHHQLLPGRLRQPLTQAACFHPGPPQALPHVPDRVSLSKSRLILQTP